MILIGRRTIDKMPYIVSAIDRMADTGLGFPRKRFRLTRVLLEGVLVFDRRRSRLADLKLPTPTLAQYCDNRVNSLGEPTEVSIRLLTPTLMRENGSFVERPDFFQITKFLLERVNNLLKVFTREQYPVEKKGLLDLSREIEVTDSAIWRHDFETYSTRRNRRERKQGLLGRMTFNGAELCRFLPLLAAGEILGIGSKTSFGLGRFEIL